MKKPINRSAAVPVLTVTSREFNQDVTRAKRAAEKGPVLITDRGKPAHVLLSIREFRRLSGRRRNLLESVSMPGLSGIDLDPPRSGQMPRPARYS